MTDEGLKMDNIFIEKDITKTDEDDFFDEIEEKVGLDENLTNRQKLLQKAGEVLQDEREVLKDKVDREIQQLPALKNQAHRIAMKLNLDKEQIQTKLAQIRQENSNIFHKKKLLIEDDRPQRMSVKPSGPKITVLDYLNISQTEKQAKSQIKFKTPRLNQQSGFDSTQASLFSNK